MSRSRTRVGVSADAFVAVVRAYADRVHDDVRRLGCTPAEAAEVVEASALGLAERLRAAPREVPDLVGAWFRDARVHAQRVAGGAAQDGLDEGQGIVRRSEDDAAAREALAQLGERDRVALLLRDAYDLPYLSVGVALGTDAAATGPVVARARLRFLGLATGAAPEEPEGHDEHLATTARLADGQLPPDQVNAAERHAAKCTTCGPLLTPLREARRLLAGLAIVAMADADRDALIVRANAAAQRLLPSAEEVAAARDGEPDRGPLSFTVVAASLGGALVLGSVMGLATSGNGVSFNRAKPPLRTDDPTPSASSATPSATPTPTATGTPAASATASATPSATARPSRSASPTPTSTYTAVPGQERIALSRASGPNGTPVQVTGTGWPPGRLVRLTYAGPLGQTGQQAEAFTDPNGRFSTTIVCYDRQNLPGPHTIRAAAGSYSASATFTAT
jgi:DNA-directed RNA polymerase specialized sigma24 family protein